MRFGSPDQAQRLFGLPTSPNKRGDYCECLLAQYRRQGQVVILDWMERLLHIGLSLCKQVPYLDVVVPLEACALQARFTR